MPDIAHAMWIHGHSMQIEHPDRLYSVVRRGYNIQVQGKPGKKTWFHFAIPTPVIVDKKSLRVGSVMLAFKTAGKEAVVKHVRIYDGPKLIQSHDVNLSGNVLSTNIPFKRFKVEKQPIVKLGVGISIGVQFGLMDTAQGSLCRMWFSSAGCDFLPL